MKSVAFIPVRGGSKSIPGKNIKLFNGHPLVYWAALAAQKCQHITDIVIATDDSEIAETVEKFGFSKLSVYHRSAQNANDTASTESVILEYLSQAKSNPRDPFVLIQATNPMLMEADLNRGFELFNQQPHGSVISCATFKRFIWNRNGTAANYDFKNRPRRQDFEGILLENGAFYINSVENILAHKNRLSEPIQICEMGENTSFEIDEPEDWLILEKIHNKHFSNTETQL